MEYICSFLTAMEPLLSLTSVIKIEQVLVLINFRFLHHLTRYPGETGIVLIFIFIYSCIIKSEPHIMF